MDSFVPYATALCILRSVWVSRDLNYDTEVLRKDVGGWDWMDWLRRSENERMN